MSNETRETNSTVFFFYVVFLSRFINIIFAIIIIYYHVIYKNAHICGIFNNVNIFILDMVDTTLAKNDLNYNRIVGLTLQWLLPGSFFPLHPISISILQSFLFYFKSFDFLWERRLVKLRLDQMSDSSFFPHSAGILLM